MAVSGLPPADQLASLRPVIVLGGPNTGRGNMSQAAAKCQSGIISWWALIDKGIIRFFWLMEPISGHWLVSVKVSESFLTYQISCNYICEPFPRPCHCHKH